MMIMGFEGWLKGFTQVKFSTAQAFDKCLLTPVTSRQASLVKILAASGCQDASLHVISTEVLVHCSWQEPKPTLASQVQAWEAARLQPPPWSWIPTCHSCLPRSSGPWAPSQAELSGTQQESSLAGWVCSSSQGLGSRNPCGDPPPPTPPPFWFTGTCAFVEEGCTKFSLLILWQGKTANLFWHAI